ncbi:MULTISPECIES: hypothetical protein [unclassified Pseudactinotalea]|uniref:hypothetical protein n=1 Tax=unclassified Pseudactinotalea TaxID=2649176 RepID=UPI00128C4315|nr:MULTISPECIES: hypothetical protein [unclassified Pseudactinotalea]MPV50949.1 hypothetical protein [Pseudactinotalea sp. HY160]QGH70429.1 hypothetical protein GCE65_13705 [Pseudactinotalea sp. HY158]
MTDPNAQPERLPPATPAELEALWAQPPLDVSEESPTFRIRDVFERPGTGTYCFGKVLTGGFRLGQEVVLEGRAGYAHARIQRIGFGPDLVERAAAGQYVTIELVRLRHRAMALDLQDGSHVYGI